MPLPVASFRCRRLRCCHETAIELKVLLANEKLMFHSHLVEGMDRIAFAPRGRRSKTYYLPERSRKITLCIEAKRDSAHVFRMTARSPNQSLESGTKVSATKFLSTEPNRTT